MEPSRQASENLAIKAYRHIEGNRAYALTPDSRNVLAILATALMQKRNAEGKFDMDGHSPSATKSMVDLIKKLSDAGLNLCQRRAHAPKPLPELWRDPVTKEPLRPPKDVKEKSLLAKVDPDLLAHFENMERDPYGYVLKLRQEEAQRKVIDAIAYDETSHNPTINPFLGNDLTKQGQFEKSVSPEVLAFCKYEARPVELPLFGANADMTIQGRLSKDADVSAILGLAGSVYRQWAYDDKVAAEAQRKAAEETLRKLSDADAASNRTIRTVGVGAL